MGPKNTIFTSTLPRLRGPQKFPGFGFRRIHRCPPSPLPQPLSITRVFELVQSLLGHTTWLTEAMGNSNEGTAYWLVPFTRMKRQDTLPGLPTSPPRQTNAKTVTMWRWPGPQTNNPVALTRPDGNRRMPDSSGCWDGSKRRTHPREEPRQCLLVIIHFTRGICPQGWAAEAGKACRMV